MSKVLLATRLLATRHPGNTTEHNGLRRRGIAASRAVVLVITLLLGGAWQQPARSQRIPQITGWTFSRSTGSGNQSRTAVLSRSDSSGVETVLLESQNVELIRRPDGSAAYRILDPSQKFGSFSEASRNREGSRSQSLSLFNLSDWGYSVFTN